MNTTLEARLEMFRKNLLRLEKQREAYGDGYVPPILDNQIDQQKEAIRELEERISACSSVE